MLNGQAGEAQISEEMIQAGAKVLAIVAGGHLEGQEDLLPEIAEAVISAAFALSSHANPATRNA